MNCSRTTHPGEPAPAVPRHHGDRFARTLTGAAVRVLPGLIVARGNAWTAVNPEEIRCSAWTIAI